MLTWILYPRVIGHCGVMSFNVTVIGDTIYGRGVEDNGQGIVMGGITLVRC